MGRDRSGGQSELKSCAARRIVGSPQAGTVRFNNGAADPQPHARAVSLGGKERIKDLVRLLRWQPHARIADRDQHLTILTALRLDGELARPIHISHRVDAVHHEVHQHLLQLHAISHDLREVCSEFRPNEYGEFRCLAVQEKHHLSNNLI
jgi:hypothetical protein